MSALPQHSKDKMKVVHLPWVGRAELRQAGCYNPLALTFKEAQRQSGLEIFMEVFFFSFFPHSLSHSLSLPSF